MCVFHFSLLTAGGCDSLKVLFPEQDPWAAVTVVAVTPSSAPIWRRVQPWAYRSAARLTSTAPP